MLNLTLFGCAACMPQVVLLNFDAAQAALGPAGQWWVVPAPLQVTTFFVMLASSALTPPTVTIPSICHLIRPTFVTAPPATSNTKFLHECRLFSGMLLSPVQRMHLPRTR
jgi:hypothetical protein